MSPKASAARGAPPGSSPAAPLSGAFRAVWRWHFYAGLLVLPFLMLMALTGALYLFTDEIDGAVYRDLSRVEPRAGSAAPVMARPITRMSAPAASAASGVATRFWSCTAASAGRMPGTTVARC